MRTVNVYEAKTHLSHLLDLAASGEEIIIARSGKPLAKLVAYQEPAQRRKPGYWRGKIKIAKDFDDLSKDLQAAFYGNAR
ncbi:MAG: type II toxin-antitoxin system prevent-host-death family antitoxin [Nitrospirota bacterium]|nr:type II toxin-antitoxin system prevent-host-death family antitoxin [Nitrospirota bacterium]